MDGVRLLESYADYLTITANNLFSYQTRVFGNGGLNSILDISFTAIQKIPDGGKQYRAADTQGRIELIFLTTGWGNDLGTGLMNGNYLTCKAISGIVGSNFFSLFIEMMSYIHL